MATAIFFHAHPDDEALFTGGSMCRAAAEGHRVVLVTATRGERGHDFGQVLGATEPLGTRRADELALAATILGVARPEILGYPDSGSDGKAPNGFCRADPRAAAAVLTDILVEESADLFITYDERGGYGHPDHIQTHRVGMLACRQARIGTAFLSTIDGGHVRSLLALAAAWDITVDAHAWEWVATLGPAGEPLMAVDVAAFVGQKRRAMAAHRTQLADDSFIMNLPEPAFQLAFGTEWYVVPDGRGTQNGWLLD